MEYLLIDCDGTGNLRFLVYICFSFPSFFFFSFLLACCDAGSLHIGRLLD